MNIDRTTTIDIYNEDNTLLKSITKGITSGSLICEEMLFESDLRFGQCCANRFEVQVNELDVNASGKKIKVTQVQDDIIVPIFTGWIDSCKKDSYGITRDIVAYDDLYYKRDIDVAEWWKAFWLSNSAATIKQLRESLCDYVGIEYTDTELINDNLIVTQYATITSITFGEILTMLCEVSCTFPNMNRLGVLEFITIDTTKEPISIVGKYETGTCFFEEYTTAPITGIAVCDTPDNLVKANGEKGNRYYSSGNVFLLSLSMGTLQLAIDAMYDVIKDLRYIPATIPMIVSDLDIKLGDIISTNSGNTIVMNNYMSGSLLIEQDIAATATSEYLPQTAIDINSSIIQGKKSSDLRRDIDELESRFSSAMELSNTAQGNSIYVEDSGNFPLIEFYVYGKSLQEGEPTPETPVDIVSVADDGNLIVVSSYEPYKTPINVTIPLDTGLRGIKVTGGGNYVDATGQQWVCDTLEKYADGTGKLVQRIGYIESYVDEPITRAYMSTTGQLTDGATIIYSLESPIETDLTTEQTAEIEKIYTFNPSTFITTDDIGDIAIEYYNNSANAELVAEVTQGLKERVIVNESSITQNAKEITLKVSKGDVSSQLSVENDQVTISGNRLVVRADNFTLESDGSATCNNMTITGGKINVLGEDVQDIRIIVANSKDNPTLSSAIGPGQMFFEFGNYSTIISAGMQTNLGYLALSTKSGTNLVGVGASGLQFGYTNSSKVDAQYTRTNALCNGNIVADGGELRSTAANGLRLVQGNYGFFIRNDGNSIYFMLTNSGDQYGSYNSLRPLIINDSTGAVTMSNGLTVNTLTLTGSTNVNGTAYLNGGFRPHAKGTAIKFMRCGTTVLNLQGTSVKLFTLATIKSWYSGATAGNTTILLSNSNAVANGTHVESASYISSDASWYMVVNGDTKVNGNIQINYTVICW